MKPPSNRMTAFVALVALLAVVVVTFGMQRRFHKTDTAEDCVLQLRIFCKS